MSLFVAKYINLKEYLLFQDKQIVMGLWSFGE